LPTQIPERVCVEWHLNFVAEIRNGVVERSYFTERDVEETIFSEFSEELVKRLRRYFKGREVDFRDVPVTYPTDFSGRVLEIVRGISFGKVRSYFDIANEVKTSPRAVGVAMKMNRVPVIVPCHRVVARNGIGGYSCGVGVKRMLLELEGVKM